MESRHDHGPVAERLVAVRRRGDLLVAANEATTRSLTCCWLGERACVTHADRPVTVVRSPEGDQPPQRHILVGVDGSASALGALHAVAEKAQLRDSDLAGASEPSSQRREVAFG